jgi:trimeric autotransporter adhesin
VNWYSLGAGLNNDVHSIVIQGSNLFAAGTFTMAADEPVSKVARWDGSRWWPLNGGADDGEVRALAWMNDRLYAAGTFTSMDGIATPGIACWDGVNWSSPGGGLTGGEAAGNAMLVGDSRLYLAGSFTGVGSIEATNIACWNGTDWQPLGGGFRFETEAPAQAWALAMNEEGDLFVGGGSGSSSTIGDPLLTRWDGENWHRFAEVFSGNNMVISSLDYFQESLYAANIGWVSPMAAGGSGEDVFLEGLGRWDGTNWFSVGAPLRYGIRSLTHHQNHLYVAGTLKYIMAPYSDTPGIVHFDGEHWNVIGNGLASSSVGRVQAIFSSPYGVLAGGQFFRDDDSPTHDNPVARWDGKTWSHMKEGVRSGASGVVYAFAADGDHVYAGGNFLLGASGGIMDWDGTNWNTMGSGLGPTVLAIAARGEEVIAGGDFGVRRWDGTNWQDLGVGISGVVRSLAFFQGQLVAGGDFISAGGSPANRIARWDGMNWHPLGEGLDAPVLSICLLAPDELVVGGEFVQAGEAQANRIARWKDETWTAMASGFENGLPYYRGGVYAAPTSVKALSRDDQGILYAGGNFRTADGNSANFVAQWDGSTWKPLGSGVDHIVYGLAAASDGVFLGGDFYHAGGRASIRFAFWRNGVFSDLPSLDIQRLGETLKLSWTATADGFLLEESSSNSSDDAWSMTTNQVDTIGGNKTVTVPVIPPQRYFRLKKE